MNYAEFKQTVQLSRRDFYQKTFMENKANIRVKKEDTVIKNLEKIFCAALKLSNRNGFQAMSMRDLGREADLSMGALYTYFSSKEELFGLLQVQATVQIRKILEDRIHREDDAPAQLRAAIETHLYLSEDIQPWFYFSFMESKNFIGGDAKSTLNNEQYIEKLLRAILEKGVREGVFAKLDCRLSASVIKAMLQDWYLSRWKYSREGITIDQYAAFTMAVVESFCLPERAVHENFRRKSSEKTNPR